MRRIREYSHGSFIAVAAIAACALTATTGGVTTAAGRGAVATSDAEVTVEGDLSALTVVGGASVVTDTVLARAGAIAEITPVRRAGVNRYATAAAVAAATFPQGVDTVYLATGEGFADALSASTALSSGRAALLLTTPGRLPADTAAALQRLAPSRVIALGGTAAISDDVVSEVRAATPATVTRIAGASRYATSAAVSQTAYPNGSARVYLATGEGFADALSASTALAATPSVLLLTDPRTLPADVANELDRLNPTQIFIIGGAAAVSDGVSAQVAAVTGVTPVRLAGSNRYDTARRVSEHAHPGRAQNVFLATGQGFADALSAGQAVIANRGALLLTDTGTLPTATIEELARLAGTTVPAEPGPPPSPTALVLSGRGPDVYIPPTPLTGMRLARATHDGSSNFIVRLLDANGDFVDLLVNEIGPVSGTFLFNSWEREPISFIEIQADGAWEIIIDDLSTATPLASEPGTRYSGRGYDVLSFVIDRPVALQLDCPSCEGNFIVWARGSTQRLLVNEIGPFSGRVLAPSGTRILEVVATSGFRSPPPNWTITVE